MSFHIYFVNLERDYFYDTDFALLGFILKYKYGYKLLRLLYSKSLFINLFLGIFNTKSV